MSDFQIRETIREMMEQAREVEVTPKQLMLNAIKEQLEMVMENLGEIRSEMKRDNIINKDDLSGEAIRCAKLHTKWFGMYIDEKLIYNKLKDSRDKHYLNQWKYYQGKQTPAYYAKFGQLHEIVVKSDVEKYLNADDLLLAFKELAATQYACVELCQSMVDNIKQRGYSIRNAIDNNRFEAGN